MYLHETRGGARRTPLGIHVAGGALAVVGATILAAVMVPASAAFGRLAVVALVAGTFAALVPRAAASLATGVLGFLLFVGFLVNDYGELTWDGARTREYLLVMTLAVALGLGQRWMRAVRHANDRAYAPPEGADRARPGTLPIAPPTRAVPCQRGSARAGTNKAEVRMPVTAVRRVGVRSPPGNGRDEPGPG